MAVSPGNSVPPRIAPTRTRWRLRKTDPFPHISPQFASSRDLHGRPLFLTIVEIQSGRHPGKAGSHLGPGVTAYGGQERYCDDGASYEILLEEPGMKWVNTSHGKVPDGARAVAEGRDGDGSPLYFAAAWIRGHRVLGKTVSLEPFSSSRRSPTLNRIPLSLALFRVLIFKRLMYLGVVGSISLRRTITFLFGRERMDLPRALVVVVRVLVFAFGRSSRKSRAEAEPGKRYEVANNIFRV